MSERERPDAPDNVRGTPEPVDPAVRAEVSEGLRAASAAVQEVIDKVAGSRGEERAVLESELRRLEALRAKLEARRVDIAIFGEIDTGKSALVNALSGEPAAEVSVRGGWTREVARIPWEAGMRSLGGADAASNPGGAIVLLDTPGVNEVEGRARAAMAREAAERADLILFVTDSDLNELEHAALAELAATGRPVLLVFNKTDLYSSSQRDEILSALADRTRELLPADHIVTSSADPQPVEVIVEHADGTESSQLRHPEPDVSALRDRMLELLRTEGEAMLALGAAMSAADASDRMASVRIEMRQRLANRLIWSFMVTKAIAVSANPIFAADVLGGLVVDASMVASLAKVYGIPLNVTHSAKLARSILLAAGLVTAAGFATDATMSLLKGLTLGVSTLVTAPIQAAAAGYGTYIVGQATRYYLEHGASWAGRSPKQVVRAILASTDRRAIVDQLRDEIRDRLWLNRHAGAGERGSR